MARIYEVKKKKKEIKIFPFESCEDGKTEYYKIFVIFPFHAILRHIISQNMTNWHSLENSHNIEGEKKNLNFKRKGQIITRKILKCLNNKVKLRATPPQKKKEKLTLQ